MSSKRRFMLASGATLLAAALPSTTRAQAFPTKSLRIVVPFPAGGSFDTTARLVGQAMTQRLGQPVLVENRPGGGTVIGSAVVAKSPPDGYTLLMVANSLVINAKLHRSLPYEPLKAFDPVGLMITSPQVIAVNAASPFRSLQEWLDAARATPKAQSIATVGPATTQHIAVEMLQRAAGVALVYTPSQAVRWPPTPSSADTSMRY